MRIDIHTHAFPRPFLERLAQLEGDRAALRKHDDGRLIAIWNQAPLPEFRLDERLAAMEREDVSAEVLSAPPVYGHFGSHTAELCALMNDLQLEIAARAPGRFYSFIHLPYHDRERSLAELARLRAHEEVVGVALASNVNGAYVARDNLDWLWEALVDAGLPAFVHPVAPAEADASPIPLPLVHFPGDTTVFAASLILSGALERFPGLELILAHYGGSLGVLGSRLDMIEHPHFPRYDTGGLRGSPSSYISRFHVDTAQGFSRAAYLAALETFGGERLLYGSDYFLLDTPWRSQLNEFLEPTLSGGVLRSAVLRDNARRLLKLPAQAQARPQEVAAL